MKTTKEIIKIIKNYDNPYPKDIFVWTDPKPFNTKITKGRFNEFIYNIVENTKNDIIKLFGEE